MGGENNTGLRLRILGHAMTVAALQAIPAAGKAINMTLDDSDGGNNDAGASGLALGICCVAMLGFCGCGNNRPYTPARDAQQQAGQVQGEGEGHDLGDDHNPLLTPDQPPPRYN